MSIVENIFYYYNLLDKYADPRTKDYPLLSSPWPILGILTVYIYFVRNVGPNWMKNRKPFDLKNVILIYDVIQVILNFITGSVSLYMAIALRDDFNIKCAMPQLSDDTLQGYIEFRLSYAYFLLKVLDLMDTIFFVLRKNFRLITFLHVYHHILMIVFPYVYNKYYPGGHLTMIGLVNLWIHVLMYSYYFIIALKPELRNNIWWKKYITLSQMTQFIFLIYFLSLPFFEENCEYPKLVLFVGITQNVVMLILFSNFYIRSYVLKKTKTK